MDIIQKITELLGYTSTWFNQYISSGLAGFLKGLGSLIIKILEFLIEVIKWLISHL